MDCLATSEEPTVEPPPFEPALPARRARGARHAAVFTLEAVDADPHPLVGGPSALRLRDDGAPDVALSDVLATREAVLYCVDFLDAPAATGPSLVWLEVSDLKGARERHSYYCCSSSSYCY